MLNHIWSVLCRRVIIDSSTNNLTISDVLEELTVDVKTERQDTTPIKQINIPLEFEVVSFWKKEGIAKSHIKAACQVEVMNPEGKKTKDFLQVIDMPSGMKRLRTMLKVMGFVVENSGEYILKVSVKEEGDKIYKTVAELPLIVNINRQIVDSKN